jgi:hypothetical protein
MIPKTTNNSIENLLPNRKVKLKKRTGGSKIKNNY